MDQELFAQIQQEFQEGRLSEAFSLLIKAAEGRDKKIQDDILLLKSKFEYYRNQYEVKGILTDKEFNIQYSKSMIGAQDALARLRNKDQKIAPANRRKVWWLPVLLLVVLSLGGLTWYATSGSSDPVQTQEDDQAVAAITTEPPVTNTEPLPTESKLDGKPEVKEEKKEETSSLNIQKEKAPFDPADEPKTEVSPPPPVKTFTVTLIRNSDMINAEILVDGQPAVILDNNPIIITIQVEQKSEMHVFEMKKDGRACKREKLITQDKQKINFNCT